MRNTLALAVLLLSSYLACGQQQPLRVQWKQLLQEANSAREKQDWPAYQKATTRLDDLLDHRPETVIATGRAAARLGNGAQALARLRLAAAMGIYTDVLHDDAFKAFAEQPEFKAIAAVFDKNRRPITHSATLMSLTEAEVLPEDIVAINDGEVLLTSVLKHQLLRAKSGKVEVLVPTQRWPMLGLVVEESRKSAWISLSAMDDFPGVPPEDVGKNELIQVELASGKILRRIPVPGKHVIGDLALLPSGDLLAGDSENGELWILRKRSAQPERVSDGFISPQTPAPHSDGRRVFIPDYVRGIAVFDLKTKTLQWLKHEGIATNGIDGLYYQDHTLIGVQNGTNPERIVRLFLNSDESSIERAEVLEQGYPELGEPNHASIFGKKIFFIANSGWQAIDKGKLLRDKITVATIRVLELSTVQGR